MVEETKKKKLSEKLWEQPQPRPRAFSSTIIKMVEK